jgi:hypothetical protein
MFSFHDNSQPILAFYLSCAHLNEIIVVLKIKTTLNNFLKTTIINEIISISEEEYLRKFINAIFGMENFVTHCEKLYFFIRILVDFVKLRQKALKNKTFFFFLRITFHSKI